MIPCVMPECDGGFEVDHSMSEPQPCPVCGLMQRCHYEGYEGREEWWTEVEAELCRPVAIRVVRGM